MIEMPISTRRSAIVNNLLNVNCILGYKNILWFPTEFKEIIAKDTAV